MPRRLGRRLSSADDGLEMLPRVVDPRYDGAPENDAGAILVEKLQVVGYHGKAQAGVFLQARGCRILVVEQEQVYGRQESREARHRDSSRRIDARMDAFRYGSCRQFTQEIYLRCRLPAADGEPSSRAVVKCAVPKDFRHHRVHRGAPGQGCAGMPPGTRECTAHTACSCRRRYGGWIRRPSFD